MAAERKQEDTVMQAPWWKQIRLVYRRSSTLAKVIVLSAIVLSTVALLTIHSAIDNINAYIDELKKEGAGYEQNIDDLNKDIADLGSQDSVEEIAKDELGLVNPDTVIIEPQQ